MRGKTRITLLTESSSVLTDSYKKARQDTDGISLLQHASYYRSQVTSSLLLFVACNSIHVRVDRTCSSEPCKVHRAYIYVPPLFGFEYFLHSNKKQQRPGEGCHAKPIKYYFLKIDLIPSCNEHLCHGRMPFIGRYTI
jgi:hypothetical protein